MRPSTLFAFSLGTSKATILGKIVNSVQQVTVYEPPMRTKPTYGDQLVLATRTPCATAIVAKPKAHTRRHGRTDLLSRGAMRGENKAIAGMTVRTKPASSALKLKSCCSMSSATTSKGKTTAYRMPQHNTKTQRLPVTSLSIAREHFFEAELLWPYCRRTACTVAVPRKKKANRQVAAKAPKTRMTPASKDLSKPRRCSTTPEKKKAKRVPMRMKVITRE
mmetsp:Transcript_87043/g.186552  ORF Transcript_87043/g.186552 Transcript_87043/m.186552 type:complete len:220 (-) Transcript_87043:734-1393(-)